jgi:tyrosine-protein kinase Etk/Wzc
MDQQPTIDHGTDEVHLQDYLAVLHRRRRTAVGAFLAVFAGVLLHTFLATPLYEASATLHVKDDKGKGGVLGELNLLTSANPIDAELEILRSRTNTEEVVRRLHLDRRITVEKGSPRLTVLEFIPAAAEEAVRLTFTAPQTFRVTAKDGSDLGEGRSGILFQAGGVRLLVGRSDCRPGDVVEVEALPFGETVEGLGKSIRAAEVGKKTNIIRLSCRADDPRRASEVVNTLVQVYLERSVAFKAEEASKTVAFIDTQISGLQGDLEDSAVNLQRYKSAAGIVKLDTEAEELIRKMAETERDRAQVQLQKKQLEFALASIRDAARSGAVYAPAVMRDDPPVAGMASRLAELEVQKRALLAEQTEGHPAVRAVQGQIDELQKKIQATYETALRNAGRAEGAINQRIEGFEERLRSLPAAERELAKLERITKVNADIYTMLLNKHEEARIARAATISNIKIVDPAIPPEKPVKPQKKKNLLLGVLLGLMAGAGLAFFREYMDDTVKEPEQARRLLGLPLLAVIPCLGGKKGEGETAGLTALSDPRSVGAEAFRSLRTALHFASSDRGRRITLITSSFPGEGKSTVSANLGVTLTQTGARVLLVDCDLRRPSLHERFGQDKVPGLTEIITGDKTMDEVVRTAGDSGLDFIGAGTIPPNPAELLGSEPMARLLLDCRERYDHVILDAPPSLAVTDTPLLSTRADQMVVVLEAGRVPVKAVARVRDVLAATGRPLAGFVFNDKQQLGEGYGYGYYGYGYRPHDDQAPAAGWRRWLARLLSGGKGSGLRD